MPKIEEDVNHKSHITTLRSGWEIEMEWIAERKDKYILEDYSCLA